MSWKQPSHRNNPSCQCTKILQAEDHSVTVCSAFALLTFFPFESTLRVAASWAALYHTLVLQLTQLTIIMGAGMKMLMALRVIVLIAALAVVGLGAWCTRFCLHLVGSTNRVDSKIHHTRCRNSRTLSAEPTTTRTCNGGLLADVFRCSRQRYYQGVDFDRCSEYC